MAKSKNNKYVFVWSNYQNLLTVEMYLHSFILKRKRVWFKPNNIVSFVRDNTIKCFHNEDDIKRDEERGVKLLGEKYVNDFLREVDRNYEKMWFFFKKLKKIRVANLSNSQIISLINEGKMLWNEQILTFAAIQAASTSILANEIKNYFNEEEFSTIIHKTKPDIADLEDRDWKKLVSKKLTKTKNLLNHAGKYPWIVAAHFDLRDVLATLRAKIRVANNQEDVLRNDKKIKRRQQYLLRGAPKKVVKYVENFHNLSLARMKIKSCWAGLDYYLLPIVEEVARRGSEDIRDINKYYFSWDMERLLLEEKRLSQTEKNRRKRCVVALWKNRKITLVSGNEAEKLAQKELGNLILFKEESKFGGTVANRGKKRGIVRILLSNNVEQANLLRKNFKNGEILVTQMTQPNIIDIAKRAGAIITDEGGMLSHAAIISREFGIPCIVGTHRATDILKDGDLVEVDAEKGVVRILKRYGK